MGNKLCNNVGVNDGIQKKQQKKKNIVAQVNTINDNPSQLVRDVSDSYKTQNDYERQQQCQRHVNAQVDKQRVYDEYGKLKPNAHLIKNPQQSKNSNLKKSQAVRQQNQQISMGQLKQSSQIKNGITPPRTPQNPQRSHLSSQQQQSQYLKASVIAPSSRGGKHGDSAWRQLENNSDPPSTFFNSNLGFQNSMFKSIFGGNSKNSGKATDSKIDSSQLPQKKKGSSPSNKLSPFYQQRNSHDEKLSSIDYNGNNQVCFKSTFVHSN